MCWIYLGNRKTYSLVDSGADISLISRQAFDKIPQKYVFQFSRKGCTPLQSVSGHRLKNFGTAVLPVEMSKFCKTFRFQIVEGLKNHCILGNDFLSHFGAKLDFGKKTLNIHNNVIPLRPQQLTCQSVTSLVRTSEKTTIPAQSYVELPAYINRIQLIQKDCVIQPLSNAPYLSEQPGLILVESVGCPGKNRRFPIILVNMTTRDHTLPARHVVGLAEALDESEICHIDTAHQAQHEPALLDPTSKYQKTDLSHIPVNQKQKIQELLDRNSDLFAKSDLDTGRTDLVKMEIDTQDHPAIKQNPYRLPYNQRQMVEDHINELLKAGIIQPSNGPWSSPLVIVDKKDGGKRYCVDYRKLNKITVKNSHPLPRIDDILASLGGSKYFTSLDLKSGYWQIEMDKDSIEKTTFTCFLGNFAWLKMPFGLSGAVGKFSELMNKVLAGIQYKFTIAYIDDIIIFSKTFEEHLSHIETVFERLRKAGLKLKMSKCEFLKEEVKYLGHIVSASGIQPDPSKVKAIQDLQPPTDVRGIRSFIGMCSYYRRFIPNFAKTAKPLTELTKKNTRFFWNEDCQIAFESLRDALIDAPILAYPDLNKPYKLYTDSSNFSVGACLCQDSKEGERVIQYVSHQLNATQQRWPIIEKEAYAMVYSIQKLRHYLLGSKFTIMTDHKPLTHLFTSEMKNARIQRWAIILDEYGGDIEFIKGSQNRVADFLSRINQPTEVNVIDSDKAPKVQLDSKVEKSSPEENHQEKFNEFLDSHPDFKDLQENDPEIKLLEDILENTEHEKHENISCHYTKLDGLLYRISESKKSTPFPGLQLVIPSFLQKPIVEEIHSGYFGGHLGIDKTYDKLRSRYYWSGMYKDVIKFVKTCVSCNMRKLRRERPPLQDMYIPKYPFECVAIDTVGPFPQSFQGNRFIINVIDMFSGWPESFATKTKSADTVAQIFLEHIIPRHSCPRVLVSDNGSEFCNAVIQQISAFFNIKHIRTSIYHPESNGKIERYNGVMVNMLAKLTSRHQRDWDTKIPSVLSAYRTAKHDSSGFSPFFVVHGRDPVLGMDTLLSPKFRYHGDEYVPTMLENLHRSYCLVRQNLAASHEKNKLYYDLKSRNSNFKVGDLVYFHDPSIAATSSTKLACLWKPYHRVLKAYSNVTFLIKDQLSGTTKVVNAKNLRLADPSTSWENVSNQPSHINQKFENLHKSYIPLRVQPPRNSKFSEVLTPVVEDTEPVEPVVVPPVSDSVETQRSSNLERRMSDGRNEINVDNDGIPLAELSRRLQEEAEENIPLSELAEQL